MPETDAERLLVLVEARVRDFEKNMQKAAGTADTAYQRMRRGSRGATDQMASDMLRSTNRINQALASASTKIGAFGKAFAAGIIAGGLDGLARHIRGVVTELADLNDAAQRIGITTKAFQELSFGFKLAGVEASAFTSNMEQFTKRIGEAATKGSNLTKIFAANKVALRDQNGNIRAAEELLRDYADLIANAASEQEQMTLATEAFGRGGGDMVLALKGGAAAIDDMTKSANEAGGVIEDELIQKASELDDRWDKMWRRFEISSKTAILNTLSLMDQLAAKFTEMERQRGAIAAGEFVGGLVPPAGTPITVTTPNGARDPVTARIDAAMGGGTATADAALLAKLRARFAKPTIVPGPPPAGGGRGGGASRIREETQATIDAREALDLYNEALEMERDLKFERDQLTRDPAEQRVYSELRSLGVDINSVRGEQLATEIRITEQAHNQREAIEDASSILADMFSTPLETGESFFDRMISNAGALGQAIGKAVGGKGGDAISAGLGGLSSGFGAQDPLMGALSGAASGLPALMTGNPIPAIIGGIGGLIGGLIGQEKKRREELEAQSRALDELSLHTMQFTTDMDTLDGQLAYFDAAAKLEVKRAWAAKQSIAVILELERSLQIERAAMVRDSARDDLREAYELETGRLRDLAGAHRAYAGGLQPALDALALNTSLTNLSPKGRVDEAERQYRSALAAGPEGDVAGTMQRFLDEAMGYYGATAEYFAILAAVRSEVSDSASASLSIASTADLQLAAAEKQYGGILGLNSTIKSMADAAAAYYAADLVLQGSIANDPRGAAAGAAAVSAASTAPTAEALAAASWASANGFATGGDFTVGGSGGTDSQMVRFRATPGEQVSIRTPAQAANQNSSDARELGRIMGRGFDGLAGAYRAEMQALRNEIAELRATTREAAQNRAKGVR